MSNQPEKKQKKSFFKKKEKQPVEYLVDKPHPFTALKEERAKTQAVIEETAVEKAVVDDQVDKLERQFQPRMDEYQEQLDAHKENTLKLPKEAVDQFQKDVAASTDRVKVLQEQLRNEQRNLDAVSKSLSKAEATLASETGKIDKQHQKNMRDQKAKLNGEIGQAKRKQKQTYKKHDKIIRKERNKTIKSFVSESFRRAISDLAAIPDVTVKAVRAQWAGLKEVASVFNRSARKASDAYQQPTMFSKTRRKPVVKPAEEVVPAANNNQAEAPKTPKAPKA